MVSAQTRSYRSYMTIAFVGTVVIWLVPAVTIIGLAGRHAPRLDWMLTLAKAASLSWAAGFSWLAWRRLDEVAREAQKFAWMVSTCAALLLTAPAMLYVRLSGGAFLAHVVRSEVTPGVYFAMGWGFLALTEMAGFFIALSAWWARRR